MAAADAVLDTAKLFQMILHSVPNRDILVSGQRVNKHWQDTINRALQRKLFLVADTKKPATNINPLLKREADEERNALYINHNGGIYELMQCRMADTPLKLFSQFLQHSFQGIPMQAPDLSVPVDSVELHFRVASHFEDVSSAKSSTDAIGRMLIAHSDKDLTVFFWGEDGRDGGWTLSASLSPSPTLATVMQAAEVSCFHYYSMFDDSEVNEAKLTPSTRLINVQINETFPVVAMQAEKVSYYH